jgi:putative transposase
MERSPTKHRKRLRRYEIPGHARFLTFSCYQRQPLLTDDAVKAALVEQMAQVRHRGTFRLHAWVIMPDHVHLLLTPSLPTWPVSEILRAIKRPLAQRIMKQWRADEAAVLQQLESSWGSIHFWQRGGGYDRNLETLEECREKISYMHANPVRRGLAVSPCDWQWSSARWYAGQRDGDIAIDPIPMI